MAWGARSCRSPASVTGKIESSRQASYARTTDAATERRGQASIPPSKQLIVSCIVLWAATAALFVWYALHRRFSPRLVAGSIVAFSFAASTLTVITGDRHDYVHFLEQWRHTLDGGDPWDQGLDGENPGYGPVFSAFAPLILIHPLFPKMVFTAAWILTALAVARLYAADPRSRDLAPWILAYFAFTPYFWIEIAVYGHFDILPAAATLAAVHLVLHKREGLSGGVLAAGVLLKTVPIVALPFLLAWARRRWGSIVVTFVVTCAAAYVVAYAIWGTSSLTAVALPAAAESDLFSIFRYLRGTYSPLRLFTDSPNVDAASLPLLIVVGATLLVVFAARRTHLVVAVVTAFVAVFALEKMGHPQFQMIVFVLLPYMFLTLPQAERARMLLVGTLAVYVAWFSALDTVYALGGQLREPPWVDLREILGLPTFLLSLGTIFVLVLFRRSELVVPKPLLRTVEAAPVPATSGMAALNAADERGQLSAYGEEPFGR